MVHKLLVQTIKPFTTITLTHKHTQCNFEIYFKLNIIVPLDLEGFYLGFTNMAPLGYIGCSRQVLLFCVVLFLFVVSVCFIASSSSEPKLSGSRRMLLEFDADENDDFLSFEEIPMKKKSSKNNTKSIKPKTIKSAKNQTKLSKTKLTKLTDTTGIKKLDSTTKSKKLNSTSKSTKKSLDHVKSGAKNKTTKASASKNKNDNEVDQTEPKKKTKSKKRSKSNSNFPFGQDESDDDLMLSEFKDLPIRFQKTLLPDLERISTTSKAYITKANKEITKGFKPYVGNKHAATIATLLSCAFVLIPLLLVSLLFNRIKTYFSLQKLLIFIQAYLSIYFSILCLSSFITGLEPLRFFYSTSKSTYLFLQLLQTLAYVFYLLLLVMYLVLVFSTDCGLGSRLLGLAQTFVGFSVGLHYYMTVFHRVVLKQAPKTNWKVQGIYATCFFLICLVANADRRKKSYLEEGGNEGKKN